MRDKDERKNGHKRFGKMSKVFVWLIKQAVIK